MADLPKDTYQPETRSSADESVLIITDNDVEDLEFFYPYYRFIEAGLKADVATLRGGAFKARRGLELKESMKIDDVDPNAYAFLYLPGGKAPAKLREDGKVLEIVRKFVDSGRLVAAVCHGPQILAAADCIRGRKIAAWPEVEKDVEKAGGIYTSAETVIDGQFVTARWPGDLPMHVKRTLECLRNGRQAKAA